MTITNLRPGARRNSPRPDPQFDNVVLLAPFNGDDGDTTTTDLSNNAHAITLNGSAALDGSARKYGFTSLACDGAATFSAQALVDAGMASGDFTIEFWYRPDGTASVDDRIFQTRDGDLFSGITIGHHSFDSGQVRFGYDAAGNDPWDYLSSGTDITDDVWQHHALVRNGTAWNYYLDGTSVLSTTYAGSIYLSGSDTCIIGAQTVDTGFGLRTNGGNIEQFRISSVARYTGAFTPPARAFPARRNFIDPDPYFDSVVLLSKFNGKDGDTTTVDSSNYNQTITGLNNVSLENTQTNFNSNTSGYFSGTGINNGWKVTTVSDSFDLSTVDFTIECWLYITTHNATNTILTTGPVSVDIRNLSRQLRWDYYPSGGGVNVNSTSTVVPLNQWNHIAVVRDGNNLHGYLNGVASWSEGLSVPDRTLRTLTDAYMGISSDSGVSNDGLENAYMEDFRVTKGVCRYPGGATFNVPVETFSTTAPVPGLAPPNLPQADPYFDSVVLLASFDGNDGDTTSADLSNSAHTLTFVGTAALDGDTRKFGFTSAQFDGNSDLITVPDSADFDLGSSDFTIECWVRFASTPGGTSKHTFLTHYDSQSGDNRSWIFALNDGNLRWLDSNNGSIQELELTNAWSPVGSQWYHVAITRESSTFRMFIDGTLQGTTGTNSGSLFNCTDVLRIGASRGVSGLTNYMDGWIENARITKGVARYTATFTPPTRAFPAVQNVISVTSDPNFNDVTLLLPFDGTDAATTSTDLSNTGHILTFRGNAELDTAVKKFGTSSLRLDGVNGTTVTAPDSAEFQFGSGDFTVECWLYYNSDPSTQQMYVSKYRATTNQDWWLGTNVSATQLYFAYTTTGSGGTVGPVGSWNPTTGQWYHLAASRQGNNMYVFADGVLLNTYDATGVTIHDGTGNICIGGREQSGSYLFVPDGWIDDVRVTKGFARYTSSFTPPTEAFPTS